MSNAPNDPGAGPVVRETRARQGLRGRHILVVLVVSTVLAAAGLFAAWGARGPDLARTGAQETTQRRQGAETFHAPEPAAIIPQPGQDHTAPDPVDGKQAPNPTTTR